MNEEVVDRIVHAVLYEGYILYPYRPSAKKNRQRFTFGRVYPEAYSLAQNGAEAFVMQTECLVEGHAPAMDVKVRFLHPMAREIGRLATPREGKNEQLPFEPVPDLQVDDTIYQTWQESVERDVTARTQLRQLLDVIERIGFHFPGTRKLERIHDKEQRPAGVILRRQETIEGAVEIAAEALDADLFRITVRIINRSPLAADQVEDQEAVLMRTFASTHTVLHVEGGKFLSLIDPPAPVATCAAECKNIGTWPVLVGEEEKGEQDAMISSPIILYDYPKIAPESPGDLFDAAEIDEILTLRIMSMTDGEKHEMRHVDEQARRILERTEALPEEHLLKMHGALRNLRPLDEDFFNPKSRIESVNVAGVPLHAGSRVRIRPKGRADVMDLALAGKTAVVETIECDAEDQIQLALVLEDDPGKDLGMLRQPGHRFFYGVDEIEPVEEKR
ncbi:MAG: hypothetical protein WCA06_02915 [Terrimicrobiaceae bacterium]